MPRELIYKDEAYSAVLHDNPQFAYCINRMKPVDAVEVDVLKAWLYEIALNNVDNPLSYACEEIISRLDGLRVFARERREGE